MKTQRWILVAALIIAVGYVWLRGGFVGGSAERAEPIPPAPAAASDVRPASAPTKTGTARAIFASGCFWCTESDFDKVPGVLSTTSGYTGGTMVNPDYRSVSSGRTGHAEAVEVMYDPSVVSYEGLLDHYWQNVDPFTAHRQFCDVGTQYRPEIFVVDAEQRAAAEASKARIQERFKDMTVAVAVSDAGVFYPAEEYHQDYYKKNSAQYRFYRYGCGRDARLQAIWGDGHS
jgi:peptide-methionine (S)-S-oxide reductase